MIMKIEFDVPNFEKELEINIIIRKDGEVVCKTAAPPTTGIVEEKEIKEKPTRTKKSSGNLMDSEF